MPTYSAHIPYARADESPRAAQPYAVTAPDPPIALGLNILRAPDDHTQSRRSRSTAPRATATADPPQHLIRVPHHPHHQYDWRPNRQWRVPPPTGGRRLLPPHRGGGTMTYTRLVPPSPPGGRYLPPPHTGVGTRDLTRRDTKQPPPTCVYPHLPPSWPGGVRGGDGGGLRGA